MSNAVLIYKDTLLLLPYLQSVDLTYSLRNSPMMTLGGVYFDTLGPGLTNFSFTVICGVERGADGYTGKARYQALKRTVLIDYATGLANNNPANEILSFYYPGDELTSEISLELVVMQVSDNLSVSLPTCPIVTITGVVKLDVHYQASPPLPQFGAAAASSSTSGGTGQVQGQGEVQYSQRDPNGQGSYHLCHRFIRTSTTKRLTW